MDALPDISIIDDPTINETIVDGRLIDGRYLLQEKLGQGGKRSLNLILQCLQALAYLLYGDSK
jgi:hypothetical protein